mmetsp:Transcript_32110/g.103642  ORF Transcript_32110/g.103642 Transcript_32110/m.103642 type:complete len:241 (+) Transcript_32110:1638-2360(+)
MQQARVPGGHVHCAAERPPVAREGRPRQAARRRRRRHRHRPDLRLVLAILRRQQPRHQFGRKRRPLLLVVHVRRDVVPPVLVGLFVDRRRRRPARMRPLPRRRQRPTHRVTPARSPGASSLREVSPTGGLQVEQPIVLVHGVRPERLLGGGVVVVQPAAHVEPFDPRLGHGGVQSVPRDPEQLLMGHGVHAEVGRILDNTLILLFAYRPQSTVFPRPGARAGAHERPDRTGPGVAPLGCE